MMLKEVSLLFPSDFYQIFYVLRMRVLGKRRYFFLGIWGIMTFVTKYQVSRGVFERGQKKLFKKICFIKKIEHANFMRVCTLVR